MKEAREQMQTQKKKKFGITRTNLLVDKAIFVAFLVALDPRMTGFAIHEWLSIALAGALIAHLLLHWQWLAAVTRRFLGRLAPQQRLNYFVNTLLFIDVTLIIFSGLMISEHALPLLGIATQHGGIWRNLHGQAANMAVIILGLHVALHWKWIVSTYNRYVLRPLGSALHPARLQAIPVRAEQEVQQ
jgi:hypothetical protein